VFYNPATGAFERSFADAGTLTPFATRPTFDLGFVIGVVLTQLVVGFYREFLSGNPTPPTPNVLATLSNLLNGSLFGAVAGALSSIVVAPPDAEEDPISSDDDLMATQLTEETEDNQSVAEATVFSAEEESSGEVLDEVEGFLVEEATLDENVSEVAALEAEVFEEVDAEEVDAVSSEDTVVSAGTVVSEGTVVSAGTVDAEEGGEDANSDERTVSQNNATVDHASDSYSPRHAKPENTSDSYTPRHAKPEDTSGSSTPRHAKPDESSGSSTPRHARTESAGPGGSIIRDTANAFRPGGTTPKRSGGGRHAAADTNTAAGAADSAPEGGTSGAGSSDGGSSDSGSSGSGSSGAAA
jgi:hypothetical protein